MHRVAVAALALSMISAFAAGCGSGAPDPLGQATQADRADTAFSVDSAGCREVANVGYLPTANVRPLVPAQFSLVGDGTPMTGFVVRTVHCDAISVDGGEARAADLVQVGAVIVAPDGDGDINNYTLYYDTTDPHLAERLARTGVPTHLVPQLEESLQVAPDGTGQYHFAVPAPFEPQLSFDGPVGAPMAEPIPFTANWWSSSEEGTVKMASSYPELFYNGDGVVLTVPAGGQLADLIGQTTVSSWPALALFDHFPSAHMDVTVR